MENPRTKWWFLAGKIIYKWIIFHGYVSHNQRVSFYHDWGIYIYIYHIYHISMIYIYIYVSSQSSHLVGMLSFFRRQLLSLHQLQASARELVRSAGDVDLYNTDIIDTYLQIVCIYIYNYIYTHIMYIYIYT